MGSMPRLQTLMPMAIFAATIAGCATSRYVASDEPVTLVRQKPGPGVGVVALMARQEGSLVVRNGCVYLGNKLAIWSPKYRLWQEDGRTIGVKDSLTGQVIKFGERKVFGGGQAGPLNNDDLDAPIPSACIGESVYVVFP